MLIRVGILYRCFYNVLYSFFIGIDIEKKYELN